ncbi:MAG: hypothetical protein JNK15_18225 [Planctomycetes bacterium]|nr:hypothetical protein [Planctomycetota bacterium]
MTILLAVVAVAAAIAAVSSGALGLGIGRSDPAGNGLAIAWVTIATLGTALLVLATLVLAACTASTAPGALPISLGCMGCAIALPIAMLRAQARPRLGHGMVAVLAGLGTAAWLGLLLHAVGRSLEWPLSSGLAGVAPCLLAATAIATAIAAARRPGRPASGAAWSVVTFPALVLRDGEAVHVVRDRDALAALDQAMFTRAPVATTIDANGTAWRLGPAAQFAEWTATRTADTLPFASVRDRVLALPALHADAARDAELRRLVAMQTSVTALTFVLPH